MESWREIKERKKLKKKIDGARLERLRNKVEMSKEKKTRR